MVKDNMTKKDTLGKGNKCQSRVKKRRQEDVKITFLSFFLYLFILFYIFYIEVDFVIH